MVGARARHRWVAAIRAALGIAAATTALLTLACPAASAAGLELSETPADVWVPNGAIQSMARHGDRLYVGGEFTRFGPQTGPGVVLDPATGAYDPAFPHFDGEVTASVDDGAGGWFVGGEFTAVGGVPRSGLAHVRANGTVDPDWAPALPDDRDVSTLARHGDRVYVGGAFASVGGQPRSNVAAVSATSGAVDPVWTPAPNGSVHVLRVDGARVYMGGLFFQVSGSPPTSSFMGARRMRPGRLPRQRAWRGPSSADSAMSSSVLRCARSATCTAVMPSTNRPPAASFFAARMRWDIDRNEENVSIIPTMWAAIARTSQPGQSVGRVQSSPSSRRNSSVTRSNSVVARSTASVRLIGRI